MDLYLWDAASAQGWQGKQRRVGNGAIVTVVTSPTGERFSSSGSKLKADVIKYGGGNWSRASQRMAALAEQNEILRALGGRYIEVFWPLDDRWLVAKVILVEDASEGAQACTSAGACAGACEGACTSAEACAGATTEASSGRRPAQLRHYVAYLVDSKAEWIDLCGRRGRRWKCR